MLVKRQFFAKNTLATTEVFYFSKPRSWSPPPLASVRKICNCLQQVNVKFFKRASS